jgi:ATP-binding cassette subfamily B protein
MKLFWKYLREHWTEVAAAVLLLGCTDVAQVFVPFKVREVLAMLRTPGSSADEVLRVAWTIGGLFVVVAVFRSGWRLFMWPLARRVEYQVRGEILAHLQKLDPGYYHRIPSGDLISRASHDVDAVRMFFSMGFAVFFDVLFVTPLAIWFMWGISPGLTLVVALPIMIAPVFSLLITRKLEGSFREAQDSLGVLTGRAQEDITGTRVLKTYAREDAAGANYIEKNDHTRGKYLKLVKYYSFIGPYFHTVHLAALVLLLMAGSAWALAGNVNPEDLVAFEGYVALLSWPTFALGWGITMLQRMKASLARVQEVLDEPPRERADRDRGPDEVEGSLAFRDLTFSYNGGDPVLAGLNLEVPAGQILGVTGPTGSGKSTLLSLAVALCEPPAGTVFLDGTDVLEIAPEKLRRHVALVQQTPYLFSRTLSENLAFARPGTSEDEVRDAVRVAGLEPDLRQFEEGLETLVGDRGITLSGGQRLRVAMGRALLARPQVLLLDDAFSAVDVHTEETVWNALREKLAGRTVLVVSHRISVLRRCDRVAVIEDGGVSELGTHAELLEREGFYSRTFALQELFEG